MPVSRLRCGTCRIAAKSLMGGNPPPPPTHPPDGSSPKDTGGVATVPACGACHHMKDRMPVSSWFLVPCVSALMELARLELLGGPWATWPDDWGDMSREARLMWAKLAREVNRGAELPYDARRLSPNYEYLDLDFGQSYTDAGGPIAARRFPYRSRASAAGRIG